MSRDHVEGENKRREEDSKGRVNSKKEGEEVGENKMGIGGGSNSKKEGEEEVRENKTGIGGG